MDFILLYRGFIDSLFGEKILAIFSFRKIWIISLELMSLMQRTFRYFVQFSEFDCLVPSNPSEFWNSLQTETDLYLSLFIYPGIYPSYNTFYIMNTYLFQQMVVLKISWFSFIFLRRISYNIFVILKFVINLIEICFNFMYCDK